MKAPASASTPAEAVAGAAGDAATRKQIRGSSLLLVGRVLSLGVNFGVQVLIVRYLTKADYGAFAYALSLVALGSSIASLGLVSVALVIGLQGVLAGSLISDERAISLLLILVVLTPIQSLDGLLMGMFAVFSKPRQIFFRKYILTPGLRLTVVLLLVLGNQSVFFLAGGYVAAAGVGVGIYAVMLYGMLRGEGLLQHFGFG